MRSEQTKNPSSNQPQRRKPDHTPKRIFLTTHLTDEQHDELKIRAAISKPRMSLTNYVTKVLTDLLKTPRTMVDYMPDTIPDLEADPEPKPPQTDMERKCSKAFCKHAYGDHAVEDGPCMECKCKGFKDPVDKAAKTTPVRTVHTEPKHKPTIKERRKTFPAYVARHSAAPSDRCGNCNHMASKHDDEGKCFAGNQNIKCHCPAFRRKEIKA